MTQPTQTPTQLLTNLLIALLAPMFLAVSGGDVQAARTAAFAAIRNHGAESDADLISVAKIIAFGLAALGALGLALAGEVSLPMLLRLQASACACDRAEHRTRRALRQARLAPPLPEPPEVDEADVIACAEQAAALARQALQRPPEPAPHPLAAQPKPEQPKPAQPQPAQAKPAQAKPAQPQPEQPNPEQPNPEQPAIARTVQDINRASWATACATVAQEFAAEMANLPPRERWDASLRSKALSSLATDLLNGLDPEPYRRTSSMP